MSKNTTYKGLLFFVLLIGSIFLANWLIRNIGTICTNGICLIPVGFGLLTPSGVLAVGLTFSFRDGVQEYLGKKMVIFAIILGAIISAFLSPTLALASGTAFLISETFDFLVYTPLKQKTLIGAIGLSNTVGSFIDSFIFLWLAAIPFQFLLGQIVGKLWMTLPVLLFVLLFRKKI